jgi:transposase InsO family protein
MPKKIERAVRERVMRMIAEHRLEYATPTELARVLAARERLGVETVRRWIAQAEVDGAIRPGVSSSEQAEIKGDAFENALMETIIGLFIIRTAVFHDGPHKTLADVEYATTGWVDWYNNRRLHGPIGMVPPVEYEQAHCAALKPEVQPV